VNNPGLQVALDLFGILEVDFCDHSLIASQAQWNRHLEIVQILELLLRT
jgi:hypothetical protein